MSLASVTPFHHALIRTHHITSRKKVAALKAAAKKLECFVLLRSGGVPGLMYVESHYESNTRAWVSVCHALRYKDWQLIAPVSLATENAMATKTKKGALREVDSVSEFAAEMKVKGLTEWFRISMGYQA